jgi:hypothetical protein
MFVLAIAVLLIVLAAIVLWEAFRGTVYTRPRRKTRDLPEMNHWARTSYVPPCRNEVISQTVST